MRFKVGDKVVVREWDDMVREFIIDLYGDININKNIVFADFMKDTCGQVLTIVSADIYRNTYKVLENSHYYSDEMLMPFEFHKSDLKDGMLCQIRDGRKFLWLDGIMSGITSFVGDTDDDLKSYASYCDIVKVGYPSEKAGTIEDILRMDFGKVIWIRKEEPTVKEFTMYEIKKILKEKFPDVDEFKINTKE